MFWTLSRLFVVSHRRRSLSPVKRAVSALMFRRLWVTSTQQLFNIPAHWFPIPRLLKIAWLLPAALANSLGTGGSSLIHPSLSFLYQLVESSPCVCPAERALCETCGFTSHEMSHVWVQLDGTASVDNLRDAQRRNQAPVRFWGVLLQNFPLLFWNLIRVFSRVIHALTETCWSGKTTTYYLIDLLMIHYWDISGAIGSFWQFISLKGGGDILSPPRHWLKSSTILARRETLQGNYINVLLSVYFLSTFCLILLWR